MGYQIGLLALIGLLLLLGASQLAVALVNWLATLLVDAAPAAANGLFQRNSAGIAHPGRRPDDAHERAKHRGSGRGAGSPVPGQSDENLHFGLLTDFRDAPEETLPEDEPLLLLARQRIEELNEKYRERKSRHVLPLSSPAPMESAGADLDGVRAQARQACGLECASARQDQQRSLLAHRRAILASYRT